MSLISVTFSHPVGVDLFQSFQLIHIKTPLEVSRYFGKIYLLKGLCRSLIFKIVLIQELNFSYNPVIIAFESYGIFDSSALNLVSKQFKLLDLVEGFPFFLWMNSKFCLVSWQCILDVYWIIMKIFWFTVTTSSFNSMFDFFYFRHDIR